MDEWKRAGLVAFWGAAGSAAFVLVLFALLLPVSLAAIVGAAALITVGGAVVGGLLATSFEHTEDDM